jgi:hypothetical protein
MSAFDKMMGEKPSANSKLNFFKGEWHTPKTKLGQDQNPDFTGRPLKEYLLAQGQTDDNSMFAFMQKNLDRTESGNGIFSIKVGPDTLHLKAATENVNDVSPDNLIIMDEQEYKRMTKESR